MTDIEELFAKFDSYNWDGKIGPDATQEIKDDITKKVEALIAAKTTEARNEGELAGAVRVDELVRNAGPRAEQMVRKYIRKLEGDDEDE